MIVLRSVSVFLHLALIVGCSLPKPMSDTQFVLEEKKLPNKALVAVSVSPAKSQDFEEAIAKIENGTILSSCGYEIELNKGDETLVPPLNKNAFDSQWGALGGNAQYYGGAVVALTGFATGVVMISASSAAGLLVPPMWYGIYPGLALVSASALAGGALGASGENKLKQNHESVYAFRELLSRKNFPANGVEYAARVDVVKKSGNTAKACPSLQLGQLKAISGLRVVSKSVNKN